jgi:hypothetical protein
MINIIIPISEDAQLKVLKNTMDSIVAQKVDVRTIVAVPQQMEVSETFGADIHRVDGDVSFQSLVNHTVENALSAMYFMILRSGDLLVENYLNTAINGYIAYNSEPSVYLNMVYELAEDGQFIGLSNHIAWNPGLVKELGYMDLDEMDKPQIILSPAAAIYKVEDFVMLGGMKKNIELFYELELIYRLSKRGYGVFFIPRIGCQSFHQNMLRRKGQVTVDTLAEIEFWKNTIGKECYFDHDRPIDKTPIIQIA